MQQCINPIDGATLLWVPAGTFVMGSSKEEVEDIFQYYDWDRSWFNAQIGGHSWIGELHPHEVELDGFWMYRDLITIGQYYLFMQETDHPAPFDQSVHGPWNSAWKDGKPLPGTENLPVSSVSWKDAVAYGS